MPSVGEQLASARQSKDWSMEDVARLTKLRTDQVLAIEEGRYQVFSAGKWLSVRSEVYPYWPHALGCFLGGPKGCT